MSAAQKKWFVFRNNEVLGPFEAQDIRNALRTGDIRAFDMVGQQDSSIRRPLVEVDEIFETKTASYVEAQERGVPYQPAPLSPDMQKVSHGYLGGAINTAKKPVNQAALKKIAKPRRSNKKYFIHRNNNIVGPLTAKEIMTLYEKGQLPKDAKIQKNGRSQKLSVEMFVERYMEARGQMGNGNDGFGPAQAGGQFDRPMGTMTKIQLGRQMDRSLIWVMGMSLMATVVVIGFLAFVLSSDRKETTNETRRAVRTVPDQQPRVTRTPAATVRATTPPPPPAPRVEPAPEPVQPTRQVVARPKPEPRKAPARPAKRTPIAVREAPKPEPRVVEKPRPMPAPQPVKVAVKKDPPAPKPKPQPAQESGAKLGAIGDLSDREDSTLRLGPLAYSMGDLDGCAAICVMSFRGAGGQSVNVKFFKNGFATQLKNKGGTAIIEGTVRGGTLLLKSVK